MGGVRFGRSVASGSGFVAEPNSESSDPAFAELVRWRFEYHQVYRYSRGIKPREHHSLIEHIHAFDYPDPEHRLAIWKAVHASRPAQKLAGGITEGIGRPLLRLRHDAP